MIDLTRGKKCAWCTAKGYQCFADGVTGPDSKEGSRCIGNTSELAVHSVVGGRNIEKIG